MMAWIKIINHMKKDGSTVGKRKNFRTMREVFFGMCNFVKLNLSRNVII